MHLLTLLIAAGGPVCCYLFAENLHWPMWLAIPAGLLAGLGGSVLLFGLLRISLPRDSEMSGCVEYRSGCLLESAVVIAISWICASVLLPVFFQAREQARETTCLTNVEQLSVAVQVYSQDYGGLLPRPRHWSDQISPYLQKPWNNLFRCPSSPDGTGYAYNLNLGGLNLNDIASPAGVPSLFDANARWNSVGDASAVVPRHHDRAVFGFADGHAKATRGDRAGSLEWKPGIKRSPGHSTAPESEPSPSAPAGDHKVAGR